MKDFRDFLAQACPEIGEHFRESTKAEEFGRHPDRQNRLGRVLGAEMPDKHLARLLLFLLLRNHQPGMVVAGIEICGIGVAERS